jgi:glucose/arabinose dehydrogenase
MGDGGGRNDPVDNAQNDEALLGKLLRLDVEVEESPFYRVPPTNPHPERGDPLGLIWAKGLRNPWRFSFDRANGDLYIADVGQGDIEEVDVQPAASGGGENYGWDIFEGNACFEPAPQPECPQPPDGFVFPVVEYRHNEGCSVTGGFVYRGCALTDLRGTYFYGDYCSAFVRSFVLRDGAASDEHDWTQELRSPGTPLIASISSFGEDTRGEIYVVDLTGSVFKLVSP